uniref:Putative secreted protein n=1 Tax=Anopheles marajoara TaxID=58244 RepID=A0A2M4C846_9DIPT
MASLSVLLFFVLFLLSHPECIEQFVAHNPRRGSDSVYQRCLRAIEISSHRLFPMPDPHTPITTLITIGCARCLAMAAAAAAIAVIFASFSSRVSSSAHWLHLSQPLVAPF